MGDLEIEQVFDLGIAAGKRVAHDDQVRRRIQMGAIVSPENQDILGREEIAHRRVNALIRSRDLEAALLKHGCERSHARAAYAHEMNTMYVSLAQHSG
jgi:hypothetical protein